MFQYLWKIIFVLFSFAAITIAQMGMEHPKPTTVRFVITVEGESEKAKNAKIELMDDLNSGSAFAYTDEDGRATFQTLTGAHRVRITGPGIKSYEGEFEITPNEMTHMERIRVQRGGEASFQTSGIASNAPVPAVRLRIPDSAHKAFEKGSDAMHKEHWEDSKTQFQNAIHDYADYDLAYN